LTQFEAKRFRLVKYAPTTGQTRFISI